MPQGNLNGCLPLLRWQILFRCHTFVRLRKRPATFNARVTPARTTSPTMTAFCIFDDVFGFSIILNSLVKLLIILNMHIQYFKIYLQLFYCPKWGLTLFTPLSFLYISFQCRRETENLKYITLIISSKFEKIGFFSVFFAGFFLFTLIKTDCHGGR